MQIQKYKYTNTQIQHMTKSQKDPTCGIFLKRALFKDIKNDIPMCQTCKYKNTNTQIQKYTNTVYDKVPERPNMWYIFEKRIVQGYQKLYSHVSNSQIHKYKYKNTQIQYMTNYVQGRVFPVSGFFKSLNNPLFKNMAHIGSFWHFVICCICVFCICIFCVCASDTWEYNF